jgi:hypothetical protein
MRVPPFDRFQGLMTRAAFFVCGLVVGSAVYSGLQNDQFDRVITRNKQLERQLDDYQKDMKRLQQVRRKETAITSVVPYIKEAAGKPRLDAMTELELKKRLKADLSIFVGRSIYMIGSDSEFARSLLGNKIYDDIGGKSYEIAVKTMLVVDGVLQVWVEAKVHLNP